MSPSMAGNTVRARKSACGAGMGNTGFIDVQWSRLAVVRNH